MVSKAITIFFIILICAGGVYLALGYVFEPVRYNYDGEITINDPNTAIDFSGYSGVYVVSSEDGAWLFEYDRVATKAFGEKFGIDPGGRAFGDREFRTLAGVGVVLILSLGIYSITGIIKGWPLSHKPAFAINFDPFDHSKKTEEA